MEIINQTPFLFAPIAGRIGFPGHSLTLIVKGTFDLVPQGTAKISEEQLYPTGDLLYPDDDEGQGSRFYESDFAFYKPRADLLLVGKCHAPGGRPVPACKVSFGVGGHSKTLGVFGDRRWNPLTRTISDPTPFTRMTLRYENSFGGPEFEKNPVGKGADRIKAPDGSTKWPLPNIEALNDLVDSPGSRPEPAGFGPLGSFWLQRRSKLGTYKGNWLKDRWPWYPVDFDWGHFNAAPADMQAEGYLKGDETLFFENLHPDFSTYHSRLPSIRPRLFVNKKELTDQEGFQFMEPKLNLDTLWVDMEAETLVLVWRAVISVLSEDYDEISDLFIAAEKLEDSPQTKEFYHGLFLEQSLEQDKISGEDIDASDEASPFTDDIDIEEEIRKADAEIRDALIAAGVDPDRELPEPTEADRREEAKLLKELGIGQETPETILTRERVMEKIVSGEGLSGEDLSGRDLSGLDLSGLDMRGANFRDAILDNVNLKASNLSGADFSRANLFKADLSSADLKAALLKDADFTESTLAGADLRDTDLRDAVFEQADMNHVLLDDCNAENAIFCEADLTGSSFANSRCRAADFSKSNLSGAILMNAVLVDASVEDAQGPGINMTGADLSGLRAAGKTDFTGGNFQKTVGPYSIWENAVLDQADFSLSVMEGANFASASLQSASFVGADLKYARLSKTNLRQARCMTMNLFEASLEKADLTMTDFRASNLYGAEFLDALINKTVLDYANLKMTKLARK